MTKDEILEKWIPYRLQAIQTLQWAWKLSELAPTDIRVLAGEKCILQGNFASIANPMIETGFIHARALLEFLGLQVKKGRLVNIKKRRDSDVAVERCFTSEVCLKMASPETVLAAYQGPQKEAEEAFVAIFELSNRWLAHITNGELSQQWTENHIEIALRGIPVLINNHLYAPLGREIPSAPIGNDHDC
jgi:hypothetical protein